MTEIQEYFHSFFYYDEKTGLLSWKERTNGHSSDKLFNNRFLSKPVGFIQKPKRSKTQYLHVTIHSKTYKVHRVIFAMHYGYLPEQIDHLDGNGLNNKIENLRASNQSDNQKNRDFQKNNKSGYIGVNWHKSAKKWQARANDRNGKRIDLGRYDNIEDAVAVRKKYEKEFGYYEYRDAI